MDIAVPCTQLLNAPGTKVAMAPGKPARRRMAVRSSFTKEDGFFIGEWGMGISVRVAGGEWLVAGGSGGAAKDGERMADCGGIRSGKDGAGSA